MIPTGFRLWLSALVCLLAVNPAGRVEAAYDAPNFSGKLIDRDALSLGPRETDEVVTALTALAANFPGEAIIDHDVREKAIALALTLRPLDGGARAAHRDLQLGSTPLPVELFQSLAAVSGALWRHGERLAERGTEPEDHRLAPLLMELSLLAQPAKPLPERVQRYQKALQDVDPDWSVAVTLQTNANASNERARALRLPLPEPEAPKAMATLVPTPTLPTIPTTSSTPTPDPTPTGAPPMAAAEIKRREGSLRALVVAGASGKAAVSQVTLMVREPSPDESSLFGLFTDREMRADFEMRATYDRRGQALAGIDAAADLVKQRYPVWPRRLMAEFGLLALGGETIPATAAEADVSLPALILLASAFSGEAIQPAFGLEGDFVLGGRLTDAGKPTLPEDMDAAALAKSAAASATAPRALFLPAPAGETSDPAGQLLDAAINGDETVLFRPQVVGYTSIDELAPVLKGPTPEGLTTALTEFALIQGLLERMAPGEIARNPAVQDRLGKVLAAWPSHASARAMLAYGARPVSAGMSLSASRQAVETALAPAIELYESRERGDGFEVTATVKKLDEAKWQLSELRGKIDPQAKAMLTAAEDALEACRIYLSLTNQGTSIGRQRREEWLTALETMEMEQEKLKAGDAGQ